MNEQFYSELLAQLSGQVSDDALQVISKQLSVVLSRYDVTKKTTDLAVCNVIPQCAKIYLVSRKIEGVKKSSLQQYAMRIEQFFRMMRLPIDKVTPNDIRIWLYRLQSESKGMSDRTLDGARTVISTFFKWANSEGYIPTNPCANIKHIKYTAKQRQHLNEYELQALRNACENIRDKAMIEFMYSTGCRVSQLVGVKIADVDFDKNEVTLFGKGEKYRQAYINAKAKFALNAYMSQREDDSPYLFVKHRKSQDMSLTKSAIELIVRQLGEKAGITRRVFPHLIRHTTATVALQRGMDITEIQKMLGHVNIETTMVYAKTSKEAVKASHRKYVV